MLRGRVVRESFSIKVAFDGQEGRIQVALWRKNIAGIGIRKFKGSEVRICLACSRNNLGSQCDIN